MTEIYSKIDPEKLLHIVIRGEDIIADRLDVVCDKEFLQLALINMDKGKTFLPHKHRWRHNPDEVITQEAWCVVSGSVKVFYYDFKGPGVIAAEIIKAGDVSLTICGGHNYEALEDNTRVYEFKTGRYYGREIDKIMI